MSLHYYTTIIEDALHLLNINPNTARTKEEGHWLLCRGSAQVHIYIKTTDTHTGPRCILVLASEVMPLPRKDRTKLCEYVMNLNFQMVSEKFGIHNDMLVLTSARYADGLNASEVIALVDSLSFIADIYDDKLIAEFGDIPD